MMNNGATAQNSPLQNILEELLVEIFNKLDVKDMMGSNNVRFVCHRWNNVIGKYAHVLIKPTKENLLRECRTKEAAIKIINDEPLRKSLTFDEWLGVVSVYDEALDAIIDDLTAKDLYTICRYNPQIAIRIYNSPSLIRKCNKFELAQVNLDIALIIYNDSQIMAQIKPLNLRRLCTHREIFELLIQNPKYRHLLNFHWAHLVNGTDHVIGWLVKNQNVLQMMPAKVISAIAHHENVTHDFLDSPRSKLLSGERLVEFVNFVSVAIRLAEQTEFNSRLSIDDKITLILKYPQVIKYWLNSTSLLGLTRDGQIGLVKLINFNIFDSPLLQSIKESEVLWSALSEEVKMKFAEKEIIAHYVGILENAKNNMETIEKTLNDRQLPCAAIVEVSIPKLLSQGKKGLAIGLKILENRHNCAIIGDNLVALALATKKAGHYIMKSPLLRENLCPHHIQTLAEHCVEYASYIADYAKSINNLPLLYDICKRYPAICEELVLNETLFKDIENTSSFSGSPDKDLAPSIRLLITQKIRHTAKKSTKKTLE